MPTKLVYADHLFLLPHSVALASVKLKTGCGVHTYVQMGHGLVELRFPVTPAVLKPIDLSRPLITDAS
jgi:hypothetical protein